MKISRRDFLKTTALTSLYFAGFGAPVNASGQKKNLVIIMLRGGMDGLSAVPPIDPVLEKFRPDILVRKTLPLTSEFSLHPSLKNFFLISSCF